MMVDEAALSGKYHLVKLNVASGTQLSTRAADVVKHLSKPPEDGKVTIVSLQTKSRNANKLISIVEIAKRELKGQSVNVFQYNTLTSEMVQLPNEAKQANGNQAGRIDPSAEIEDDSDDAFETMGSKDKGRPKQRLIPVMATYLSNTSIKELKLQLGEQRSTARAAKIRSDPASFL